MVTFLLLRVKSCQINVHKNLANIAIQLNLILLKPSYNIDSQHSDCQIMLKSS